MASNNEGRARYQAKSRTLLREFCDKMRTERKMNKKAIAKKYSIEADTFRSWMRDSHCGAPTLLKHGLLIADILFPYPFGCDAPESIFEPSVPELLRAFRREQKMTLASFARYAQVDPNTVFLWEHGKGSPSLNKHFPVIGEFLEWAIAKDIQRKIRTKVKTVKE